MTKRFPRLRREGFIVLWWQKYENAAFVRKDSYLLVAKGSTKTIRMSFFAGSSSGPR